MAEERTRERPADPARPTGRTRAVLAAARRPWSAIGLLLVVLGVLTAGLVTQATSRAPMSIVDEHIHLDYAFAVHRGELPYRGRLLGEDLLQEWACGIGHEAGPLSVPCGSPDLSPDSAPSGKYSTAYIHYPTYFIGAEGWRGALGALGLATEAPVAAYRTWSAFLLAAGGLACMLVALASGLRGARLVAATLVPISASTILLLGGIVNPTSAAILQGALIAGASVRWVRTGDGFWWLAGATAFASVTAVVHTLPVGGAILAAAVALVLRRRGVGFGPWRPRWWQVAVLATTVLVPVLVWGQVIAARATVPNSALYAFTAPQHGLAGMLAPVAREVSSLHEPWRDAPTYFVAEGARGALREAAAGLTGWLGYLVPAMLVLVTAGLLARRVTAAGQVLEAGGGSAPAPGGALTAGPVHDPLRLLAGSVLAVLVLYPPALRLANAVNFGIDFPVVSRYSIAFAPVIALLVALKVPGRVVPWVLAGASLVVVLGVISGVWW